jgi:hypothetical protein
MYIIIYKKSTGKIVFTRTDTSAPTPQSPQFWLSVYIKDNKLSAAEAEDLTFVETEPVEGGFELDQYKWNESTQQLEVDPNYVAPTPIAPAEITE